MNYNIRPYKNSDFDTICEWHKVYDGNTPMLGSLVEEGTFILEINNIPALCLTVLMTQSYAISYIFNYMKNPDFQNTLEKEGHMLWNHCFSYAKKKGYLTCMCYAAIPQLKEKYERFGMLRYKDNLTQFVHVL